MDDPARHLARLQAIAAKIGAIAPSAVVFGSAARGEVPNDLDVFAVLDPRSAEAGKLLALARANYGWLDVFIRPPGTGRLLVRNETATGWATARNARCIVMAIERDGIPLGELRFADMAEGKAERNGMPGEFPR